MFLDCITTLVFVHHFTTHLIISIKTSIYFLHSELHVLLYPVAICLGSCLITTFLTGLTVGKEILDRITRKKILNWENWKFFTGFRDKANFSREIGIQHPLAAPLGVCIDLLIVKVCFEVTVLYSFSAVLIHWWVF